MREDLPVSNYKLGQLYETALNAGRLAADPLALSKVRQRARHQCSQAIDLMLLGMDDEQAQMMDWAEANGYPSWKIVLRYARTTTEDVK
jgi:hypothetical protein